MQLSVFMRCDWETKTKKYIYGLCRFVKSGGNGNGRTTVKWEILFAVLDTLKVSQRVSREVSYTFSENQLLASLQGHMFESDSGVGLKCFETKVRHIQSHNRGLSKEKKKRKGKKSLWPLTKSWFLHHWSTSQLGHFSTVRQKKVPMIHIAIHCCPEALCILHRPTQSLITQPSVSQARTLNQHRIMATSQRI